MTSEQRIDAVATYLLDTHLAKRRPQNAFDIWPGLTDEEFERAAAAAFRRLVKEHVVPAHGAKRVVEALFELIPSEGTA